MTVRNQYVFFGVGMAWGVFLVVFFLAEALRADPFHWTRLAMVAAGIIFIVNCSVNIHRLRRTGSIEPPARRSRIAQDADDDNPLGAR